MTPAQIHCSVLSDSLLCYVSHVQVISVKSGWEKGFTLCLLTVPSALPFSCAASYTWNTSQEPVHHLIKTINEVVLPKLKCMLDRGRIVIQNSVRHTSNNSGK